MYFIIKVQKIRILGSNKVTWLVLGDDYLSIEPIEQFLSYLRSTEKSPNTIRSYAHHLKHYFQFLQAYNIEWAKVTTEILANFISWLRKPDSKVVCIHGEESRRLESTVNVYVEKIVCTFLSG
ncbi:hypothetical protein C7B70_08780 [Chlorogloea sp. CCALA 695]|nr:hypothetical protein C7B70_08780 [Chlorogloea sp. CCALA 695]